MGKNLSKEELRAEREKEKAAYEKRQNEAEKKRKAEELLSEPWRMNKKKWMD